MRATYVNALLLWAFELPLCARYICALVADQAYARSLLAIRSIREMVWASEVTHDQGGDRPVRGHRDDNKGAAFAINRG